MTAVLMTPPYLQFFDASGLPLAGGKVYTYTATGTFSTAKATYTTAAASVEHPNPVILDSGGRPTTGNGSIWMSGTYDIVVKDSNDATIETTLGVTAFTTLSSSSTAYFESFSGTGSQTAFTTSSSLGTDEKAIYVWVNSGLTNVVTNGTFATDTGWTKGSGWTIAAGVATATGAISTAISQTAAITLVEGQAYRITYTITRSAGGLIPSIGGTSGTERTASGTYNEVIVAGSSQTIAFTGNAFTGTLDTVLINVASTAGYEIQNPSAYTISGTTLTFATAPVSGTNNIYVSAPSLLVGAASSSAADAAASAAAALASETQAGVYAGQLTIVSTTSLAIGTGSKVFTVASGLALEAGQFILIASDASPTVNYMWGVIASYSSTTLTITVTATGGSGTLADWTMYLTGARGATGATGSISDFTGVATATAATGDYLVFQDISDSNLTKRDTVANLLSLASGTLVLLQAQTASTSASIAFSSTYLTTTYKQYIFELIDVVAATDNVSLGMVVSEDNGSTYKTTNEYNYVGFDGVSSSATPVTTVGSSSTSVIISPVGNIGNTAGRSLSGRVIVYNPLGTAAHKLFLYDTTCEENAGANAHRRGSAAYKGTTNAINNIKFTLSSGNITSGTFKLYGVL